MKGLLLALALLAAPAHAFPDRDIRLLIGFAPGGTGDLLTRLIADAVGPVLGQKVVVENRAGASGMLAADVVAKAAPDGHIVFVMPMALGSVLPVMPGVRMPFDPDRDLTPLANVAGVYNLLVVAPQSPIRSIPELIAQAKANPGKLSYASTGNGSSQHLAGELFKKLAGVDLLHVPYRGGSVAIIDIAAGRTDMMFGNMPEFLGQIRDGGLRAVAFGAARPSPLFPDLPTVSATLPDFVINNWFGVAGPGNLPAPIVARWNAALREAVATPTFRERMTANGMESLIGSPEEFRATIAADRAKWAEVIRGAGIRAD